LLRERVFDGRPFIAVVGLEVDPSIGDPGRVAIGIDAREGRVAVARNSVSDEVAEPTASGRCR